MAVRVAAVRVPTVSLLPSARINAEISNIGSGPGRQKVHPVSTVSWLQRDVKSEQCNLVDADTRRN